MEGVRSGEQLWFKKRGSRVANTGRASSGGGNRYELSHTREIHDSHHQRLRNRVRDYRDRWHDCDEKAVDADDHLARQAAATTGTSHAALDVVVGTAFRASPVSHMPKQQQVRRFANAVARHSDALLATNSSDAKDARLLRAAGNTGSSDETSSAAILPLLAKLGLALPARQQFELALFEGDAPAVVAMIEQDPTLLRQHSWQAIFMDAAQFEHKLGLAAVALSHGALVDAVDSTGATALMHALRRGTPACWKFVLRHGADPLRRLRSRIDRANTAGKGNPRGLSVVQRAVMTGRLDFFEAMAEVPVINNRRVAALLDEPDRDTTATERSDLGSSSVGKGRKSSIITGYTPLWLAISLPQPRVAEVLLKKIGVKPNPPPVRHGWSLLHEVAIAPDHAYTSAVVDALVDRGAVIEAQDDDGMTPLLLATQRGRMDVVRALIYHHANVHAVNRRGQNVLLVAVSSPLCNKLPDLVATLLNHGADADMRSRDGLSARSFVDAMRSGMPGLDPKWTVLAATLAVGPVT